MLQKIDSVLPNSGNIYIYIVFKNVQTIIIIIIIYSSLYHCTENYYIYKWQNTESVKILTKSEWSLTEQCDSLIFLRVHTSLSSLCFHRYI